MQSHGNLLLRGIGQSRGRGAEYWGAQYLDNDKLLHRLGIPERGKLWYSQQSADFRKNLDAFAAGINAYAAAHPQEVPAELKQVLPVDGSDPITHAHRIIHAMVVLPEGNVSSTYQAARSPLDGPFVKRALADGSNSWLVNGKKSANGTAMLLNNPHRGWSDDFIFYEAQIVAPGVNMYGITHVGFPVLRYSFNDTAGFAQTVNPLDGSDLYQLTSRGDGYLYDGKEKAFESRNIALKIREPNGRLRTETVVMKSSIQGPVVREDGFSAVAVRMAGLDRPKMLEQYWRMGLAKNLKEFEEALRMMQIPIYTVLYADSDGHILYVFYGLIPDRRGMPVTDWSGLVPGDTSKTLWTKLHSYDDLPKVLDPPTGFLQNTNDGPVSTTWPYVLDPKKYPSYMVPRTLSLRTSRSLKLLLSEEKLTFERLIQLKHSTRAELADRILPDLIKAAETQGSPTAKEAAKLLSQWDRQFNADSRGAALFALYGQAFLSGFGRQRAFRVAPDPLNPLETPRGIADPARAVALLDQVAQYLKRTYGRFDLPYGDLFRFRRGRTDVAANGGSASFGLFRTFEFQPTSDGKFEAMYGDGYVAVIEFSKPLRARVLMGYGDSSQPGSKHLEDQVPFLEKKQLRPCWRTRAEVEANLEKKQVF